MVSSATKPIVLAEQWRRYKRTGERQVRDQLILAYSPLVKYVAGRIAARMPAHVDIADLVSYGLGGLIEAVERFEPARGIKFESYADRRIRGAIFDELRSLDWVPRAVRAEARAIEDATQDLSTRLQRMPSDAELAGELCMDQAQLSAALLRVADTHIGTLDEPRSLAASGGVGSTLLETLPDPHGMDPVASAGAEDLRERLAEAIEHLAPRERVVLALRYEQELTLVQIGEILGVSESRTSQLHAKAVNNLKALLVREVIPA